MKIVIQSDLSSETYDLVDQEEVTDKDMAHGLSKAWGAGNTACLELHDGTFLIVAAALLATHTVLVGGE